MADQTAFAEEHTRIVGRLVDIEHFGFSFSYNNEYTEKSPPSTAGHIHSEYEIYINVTGDISFIIGGKRFTVSSGDAVLTRPNEPHFCLFNDNCRHEHYCIWFRAYKQSELLACFSGAPAERVVSLDKQGKAELLQLCEDIRKLNDNSEQSLKRSILILRIISLLSGRKNNTIPSDLPEDMQKIIAYIDAHFTDPLTVSELARHGFISSSTVNRRFRRYFAVSPVTYIETKRMAYAKELLDAGKSVLDACMLSGFGECSYFIRRFRTAFGCTPGKYRSGKS